jgi:hypothetical protein
MPLIDETTVDVLLNTMSASVTHFDLASWLRILEHSGGVARRRAVAERGFVDIVWFEATWSVIC